MSTLTDAGIDAQDAAIPSGFAELITAPEPVPPGPLDKRKPVHLQLQRIGGIYFTVCIFDANSELSEHYVRSAVELLTAVDPSLAWRITAPGLATGYVLETYAAQQGWKTA